MSQFDSTVLAFLSASPSQMLDEFLPQSSGDSISRSSCDVSQQGAQLHLTQIRQGTTEGIKAEGTLVTLVFNINLSALKFLTFTVPLSINRFEIQLADSLMNKVTSTTSEYKGGNHAEPFNSLRLGFGATVFLLDWLRSTAKAHSKCTAFNFHTTGFDRT